MLPLSTQHSTSTSGSNRRVPPPRGSSSQVHLGHPLPPALAVWVSLVRGVSSHRGAPPADPRFLWSALPSSASTSSFLWFPICARYVYRGGRMCFPVRVCWSPQGSHWVRRRFCPAVLQSLCLLGRPDVLSWPRLRTSSSLLLHSSFLLSPSCLSCTCMLWTVTAFGSGGGSRTGLCGLVAPHLVCPIACRFMEDSISEETGRSALRLQRSFEFAFSILSVPAVP